MNDEPRDWQSIDMGWGVVRQPLVSQTITVLGTEVIPECTYFVRSKTGRRYRCVLYHDPFDSSMRATVPMTDLDECTRTWVLMSVPYNPLYDCESEYDENAAPDLFRDFAEVVSAAGTSDWMSLTVEASPKQEGFHKWQSRARAIRRVKLATRRVASMLSRGKAKARPKR